MSLRSFLYSTPVFLTVFLLQEAVVTQLRLPLGGFNLLLIVALIWAALSTPEIGALTGLIAGLMYDFILPTPVGLTSLALGLAGATAGLLTYFFHEPTWWMRLITVGVVSLLGEIYYPLAQAVVGLDGWLQLRIIKVALVVAVCNLALSPIAVLVCRWTLAERKLSV